MPSSSLLPDDPSVLFTTAGMQQFKPYYTGEADPMKDFGSLNTASIQKSMRTSDIDEVGDESHLTFFEMLGNFSFGGYWKEEAIKYAHEFITKEMGLEIGYVSIFGGEGEVPADEESEKIWKSLDSNIEVKKMGRADNFWGPTGAEGPCGPTTEIYVNGVEIWNIVFNQYYQHKDKTLEPLKIQGIDTGMGLERLTMVVQKKNNIFETDLFESITNSLAESVSIKAKRIIADHIRASIFLISDGLRPSNKDQGYVLRRLLRRIIVQVTFAKIDKKSIENIFKKTISLYGSEYSNLNFSEVLDVFNIEDEKFEKTLPPGLKEFQRLWETGHFSGGDAYYLHESFGFPFILTEDLIKNQGGNFDLEKLSEEYGQAALAHKDKSRAGAEKKFGGHGLLLDTGELKAANEEELKIVTRLHTATHMLHAALRKVLGEEVRQAGSDITAERLRFDFTFPRKLTTEEIKQVEDLVNEAIEEDLQVIKQELPYEEAVKTGALSFFKLKYPPKVNVYSVGDFSKELCGGPHVTRSGEIGHFRIIKEEASSAGVRRIRAVVE